MMHLHMYLYHMDNDYDVNKLFELLQNSSSYEEFRMKCDLEDLECIITQREFEEIRSTSCFDEFEEVDVGLM